MRFTPDLFLVATFLHGAVAHAQHQHEATPEPSGVHDEQRLAEPAPAVMTSRDGSGTAWLPSSTPMHGYHVEGLGFQWMLHGQLHAGLSWQGTERGEREALSTNWFMAMGDRPLGDGELQLRTMLSLELLTLGDDGYPLLLQTGETLDGRPLIDRQHPHDLFMELAARVRHPLVGRLGLELYGGLAGEPALGPVAFPHRPSAMQSPLAPLGHHWLDSSHISFGVVTAGLTADRAKLEISAFNGREPDEDRHDLDLRSLDSVAVRAQALPTDDLALQLSWGYLDSPEVLHPDVSVQRVTASVAHGTQLGRAGRASSLLAWGRNIPDEGEATDALLAEAALDTDRWGTPFVRAEQITKSGEELVMAGLDDEIFTVHAVSLGYLYELPPVSGLRPGIGAVGTLTHLPDDELVARYGDSALFAGTIYATLRPDASRPATHHQVTRAGSSSPASVTVEYDRTRCSACGDGYSR